MVSWQAFPSLPPCAPLAFPSRHNPLSLPFQTPATQANAILNERSKEDFRYGSHLCLLTCARWGHWTLQKNPANQRKVSFVCPRCLPCVAPLSKKPENWSLGTRLLEVGKFAVLPVPSPNCVAPHAGEVRWRSKFFIREFCERLKVKSTISSEHALRATVRKYRPSSGKSWKIDCLHFLSINSV